MHECREAENAGIRSFARDFCGQRLSDLGAWRERSAQMETVRGGQCRVALWLVPIGTVLCSGQCSFAWFVADSHRFLRFSDVFLHCGWSCCLVSLCAVARVACLVRSGQLSPGTNIRHTVRVVLPLTPRGKHHHAVRGGVWLQIAAKHWQVCDTHKHAYDAEQREYKGVGGFVFRVKANGV